MFLSVQQRKECYVVCYISVVVVVLVVLVAAAAAAAPADQDQTDQTEQRPARRAQTYHHPVDVLRFGSRRAQLQRFVAGVQRRATVHAGLDAVTRTIDHSITH